MVSALPQDRRQAHAGVAAMTRLATRDCKCTRDYYSGPRPKECPCGNRLLTEAQLHPPIRKPIRRVSEKRAASPNAPKGNSTLKRGRGMAVSPAQQKKVKNLPCVVCGRDRHEGVEIQAMHVYPRRFATCDCAEGVVPAAPRITRSTRRRGSTCCRCS